MIHFENWKKKSGPANKKGLNPVENCQLAQIFKQNQLPGLL